MSKYYYLTRKYPGDNDYEVVKKSEENGVINFEFLNSKEITKVDRNDHDLFFYGFDYVVSSDLKNELEKYNIPEVTFIPAVIRPPKGEDIIDFYLLRAEKVNEVIDVENSIGDDVSYEKYTLDSEKLEQIPLTEKLLFRISEFEQSVFHESLLPLLKRVRFTVPLDIELLTPEFGWQEFFEDQNRGLFEILFHAQKSSIDLYEIDGDEDKGERIFVSAIIGLLNFICENFDIDINDSGVDEALELCDLPEVVEFVKQQRKSR